MKKLSSLFKVALFLVLFSIQAFAGGGSSDAVIQKQKCPPGASCSENYILNGPVLPPVIVTPEVVVKKKKATPEGIPAYRAEVEEARSRDNDRFIKLFSYESQTGVCSWSEPQDQLLKWLIQNKDITIDYKEYSAPSYKVKTVSKYIVTSTCTTMIVVHYHEMEE